MSENPYQAPTVSEVAAPLESLPEAVQIRQAHLKHEASLKGMGSLFFLGGILCLFSLVQALWVSFAVSRFGVPQGPEILILIVILGLVPLQFSCWWGLRKLKPWVSIPAGILTALGLLGFPVGTILGIYFLYILFCAKGRFILSPAYQEIVDQTPGMKYKTPLWNWIVLGVIVILVIGGVAFAIIDSAPEIVQRIDSIAELRELKEPVHLALGVFDGVHLGHQEVIGRAVSAAREQGGLREC